MAAKAEKRTRDSEEVEENQSNELAKIEKPFDEYEKDSSDEEDVKNTVGNIPMEWYKDHDHIGYDIHAKKILKPKESGDKLDDFLAKNDDPNYWRTVLHKETGTKLVLTDELIQEIKDFENKKWMEKSIDPHAPFVDFFTNETMMHAVTGHPDQKRSFVPSRFELKRVGQIVDGIKRNRIKMSEPERSDESDTEDKMPVFRSVWSLNAEDSESGRRYRQIIPFPKQRLPGHAESYNPAPEYLFDDKEKREWEEKEPSERRLPFIPKKYSRLLEVPAYPQLVNDAFRRCLDRYLVPRQIKKRANVRAEDLLPKLPNPRDLQPFPTRLAMVYEGHSGPVMCVTTEPSGHYIASGSADCSVRVWEISTGRCVSVVKFEHKVNDIAWNPSSTRPCIAVAVNNEIVILKIRRAACVADDSYLNPNSVGGVMTYPLDKKGSKTVTWQPVESGAEYESGIRLKISHPSIVHKVVWHAAGNHFSVVMREYQSTPVLFHQLSAFRTQNPFKKSDSTDDESDPDQNRWMKTGDPIQNVMFHPSKALFFVATQRHVKQYDLVKKKLTKTLQTNCQWVSSLAVHPGGDHMIIGSYGKRLAWFDLELSAKPFKVLRHHKMAVRQVCYHQRYPLFGSASDDGTVIVYHGMVYNDLTTDPLIVPVKILKGHKVTDGLGVLDCVFHPKEPWIFSAGADGTVRLFH